MAKRTKAKVVGVTLRVEIDTVHGAYLEDVLKQRHEDWYTHYVGALEKALKKQFRETQWYVDNLDYYGTIYFDVHCVPRSKIAEVMQLVNNAVQRWDNKYRISKMKPIEHRVGVA